VKGVLSSVVAGVLIGLSATTAAAKTVHIEISKLVFEPASVTVDVGDTVEWTNKDIVAHTATAKDKSWEVDLPPGASGTYQIGQAGAIDYFCRFHPNMRGKIAVTAP
jgi:plastocyanin